MDIILIIIIFGLYNVLKTRKMTEKDLLPAYFALEIYKKTKQNKFKTFEAANERE